MNTPENEEITEKPCILEYRVKCSLAKGIGKTTVRPLLIPAVSNH